MKSFEIYKAYGTDFRTMTERLLEKAGLEEELSQKARALGRGREDLRITVKPNLVAPTPADYGATTHTEIVEGILEFLRAGGWQAVTIAEGSWVGDSTADAFEYCGYNALSRKYGVPLVDNQKAASFRADCAGMELSLCECVRDTDFLINVPVLKGHCQTKMTCALKNLKGLIPNAEKRRFHKLGLHGPIAHLNAGIRQDFIVVDHVCGDPDFEEGGNPLVRNCVMAAKDPVLTDAYAAALLGYRPEEIGYVTLAEKLGVGSADLGSLRTVTVEGENTEDIPETRRILEVNYAVDAVDSCSACYGALIGALIKLKDRGYSLDDLDGKVCIGQGYRGRSGCFGVGACTAGFEESVPGCPPEEDDILEALLGRLSRKDA